MRDATIISVPGITGGAAVQLRPANRGGVRLASVMRTSIFVLLTANLVRIPVASTDSRGTPLLPNDVIVGVLALLAAGAALLVRSVRLDRAALAGLVFATIGTGAAVVSAHTFSLSASELAVSLAYQMRWLLYFSVFYITTINVVRRRDVSSIWHATELMLLVFAGFGIVQALFLPGFAQRLYPDSRLYLDWDPQGHRLVSTVLDPNIAGAMLLIGLLVQLGQLSAGAKVAHWRPIVFALALVLTLSRSAALGLLVGLVTIVLARGLSRRLLKWLAAAAILLTAALPKLVAFGAAYGKFSFGGSAALRVVTWLEAWRVFRDHPWFGIGFNTFGFVHERYGYEAFGTAAFSSDGGLFFVAVLTGVTGLAVFIWMLSHIVARCRRIWRDASIAPEHRGIAIGAAAAVVAICVDSLFVNTLLTTVVMELLWIVSALTYPIAVDAGE